MAVDLTNFYNWMDKILQMSKTEGQNMRSEKQKYNLELQAAQNAPSLAHTAEIKRQFDVANPPGFSGALGALQKEGILSKLASSAFAKEQAPIEEKQAIDPMIQRLQKGMMATNAANVAGIPNPVAPTFWGRMWNQFTGGVGEVARQSAATAAFKKSSVTPSDYLNPAQMSTQADLLSKAAAGIAARRRKQTIADTLNTQY